MKRKLIILSPSLRIKGAKDKSVPAAERFSKGVYFQIIQKAKNKQKMENIDVAIISEIFGLIFLKTPIPYYESRGGTYSHLSVKGQELEEIRELIFAKLQEIAPKYNEFYINISRNLLPLLGNIKSLEDIKFTYAKGSGVGEKGSHMVEWINGQN